MPRRRILLPEYPLHIVQRGINREPCLFGEEGYQCYLHWLEEAARDCGCTIHAYVLMTNRVYLLLTPAVSGAPARLMQSRGHRYVQYANRHYRRTGSLWEGRYKSSVVQAESFLLACMRHMELNPVRAAMVADPGGYRWSSYRANALAQPNARLTPHPLYLGLDVEPASRCNAYRALFRPQLDGDAASDVRAALKLGMPLGSERFAEAICARLGIPRNTGTRGRAPGDERESPMVLTEQRGIWILKMEEAMMRNEKLNDSDPFGGNGDRAVMAGGGAKNMLQSRHWRHGEQGLRAANDMEWRSAA